jgi:hypothetical protein
MRGVVGAVVVVVLAGAGPAEVIAEDDDEIYVPELRSGGRKIVGAGFGIGMFSGDCQECLTKGGVAVEIYGGYQLTERLALLGYLWSTIHVLPVDTNPGAAGYVSTTAAAQVWITPTLYLRGGLGVASFAVASRLGNGLDLGPGLILSVGGELGHRPGSGIDLSLTGAGSAVQSSELGDFFFLSAAALVSYHRN